MERDFELEEMQAASWRGLPISLTASDLECEWEGSEPAEALPRPILDGIIVHQVEPVIQRNGIFFPDRAKEWPPIGIVVAVGPGKIDLETGERIPMSVAVGDRILFQRRAASEMQWLWRGDSDRWLHIHDEDVVAFVGASAS